VSRSIESKNQIARHSFYAAPLGAMAWFLSRENYENTYSFRFLCTILVWFITYYTMAIFGGSVAYFRFPRQVLLFISLRPFVDLFLFSIAILSVIFTMQLRTFSLTSFLFLFPFALLHGQNTDIPELYTLPDFGFDIFPEYCPKVFGQNTQSLVLFLYYVYCFSCSFFHSEVRLLRIIISNRFYGMNTALIRALAQMMTQATNTLSPTTLLR
jgi:hypothetical protein